MTIKRTLLAVAALACIALGFFIALQIDRARYENRSADITQRHDRKIAELRAAAERWADSVARTQGETIVRAFAAGISPAVLAGRREGVEIAAVSLLHVPGIAGIHVLGLDGTVLYSSDAKVVATGAAEYRGQWALQVSEFTSRPSARTGVIDMAVPIVNAGQPLAVAWLEYDVGSVQTAARPAELGSAVDTGTSTDAAAGGPGGQ